MEIDYGSPAELFIPKRGGRGRRQTINYRRFATAAEAVRFAVEEFPAVRTLGAWMQVGDHRYDKERVNDFDHEGTPPAGQLLQILLKITVVHTSFHFLAKAATVFGKAGPRTDALNPNCSAGAR
jgi:hypothetical protein